jgi:hypothetical protein
VEAALLLLGEPYPSSTTRQRMTPTRFQDSAPNNTVLSITAAPQLVKNMATMLLACVNSLSN